MLLIDYIVAMYRCSEVFVCDLVVLGVQRFLFVQFSTSVIWSAEVSVNFLWDEPERCLWHWGAKRFFSEMFGKM